MQRVIIPVLLPFLPSQSTQGGLNLGEMVTGAAQSRFSPGITLTGEFISSLPVTASAGSLTLSSAGRGRVRFTRLL